MVNVDVFRDISMTAIEEQARGLSFCRTGSDFFAFPNRAGDPHRQLSNFAHERLIQHAQEFEIIDLDLDAVDSSGKVITKEIANNKKVTKKLLLVAWNGLDVITPEEKPVFLRLGLAKLVNLLNDSGLLRYAKLPQPTEDHVIRISCVSDYVAKYSAIRLLRCIAHNERESLKQPNATYNDLFGHDFERFWFKEGSLSEQEVKDLGVRNSVYFDDAFKAALKTFELSMTSETSLDAFTSSSV